MISLQETNNTIFESVVAISTSPEFQQNQQEFYHKKMNLFNKEEENKLEYTNVYQDYVLLMEQLLDLHLKSAPHNHTEEQVDKFYETFKDNQENYRKINEDVMDLLFGLVDFQTFKTRLLEYKGGFVNQDAAEVDADNQKLQSGKQGLELEEFMKEYNQDPDDKSNAWQRKITQKDVKNGYSVNMWQRKNEVQGAPDWLRIQMVMENISDRDFMLTYMKKGMSDGDMIQEFKLIEDYGEEHQVYYWRMKMPMMSERDNVAQIKMTRMEGDKQFFQMISIDHKDYPVSPNVVRMYQNVTGFIQPHLTIPKCWNYCEIDQFDMKGNFPARLFNMVLASSTKAEMEKMYKIVKDKE